MCQPEWRSEISRQGTSYGPKLHPIALEFGCTQDYRSRFRKNFPDYYDNILIYPCNLGPRAAADTLLHFERVKGIKQMYEGSGKDKFATFLKAKDDISQIPANATHVIIINALIINPFGSVVFFASQNDQEESWTLLYGFYYHFEKTVYRIISILFEEWANAELGKAFPTLEKPQVLVKSTDENSPYAELFSRVLLAVDAELDRREQRANVDQEIGETIYRIKAPVDYGRIRSRGQL
jgi:hypothetical protein